MAGEQLFRTGECPNCRHEMLRAAKADQQLALLQAENAKLRECVELYADEKNWVRVVKEAIVDNVFVAGGLPHCPWEEYTYPHGYEPAQACLKKGGDAL